MEATLTQVVIVAAFVAAIGAMIWAAQRRNFVTLGLLGAATIWFLAREFIFSDGNMSLFAPINWSVGEVVGFLIVAAVIAVLTVILLTRGVIELARVLAFCVLAFVVFAPLITWDLGEIGGDGQPIAAASPEPRPTETVTETVTESPTVEVDAKATAEYLAEIYQGFAPGELAVGGQEAIPDSPEERSATASFTGETIRTREDLINFLNSDRSKAQKARQRVESALREAGYGDDEVNTAFTSGERWIWVAPTVESQIFGTTYLLNGEIVKAESWRQTAPNDAIWFYVTTDSKLVQGAAVRADCGNPDVDKVRPVRPDMPDQPPVDVPPGEEKPKCFDADGNPVYDGEFCGTPDSGPDPQPVQDNNPEHVAPTDDYEPGNAEEVVSEQDDDAQAVEDGEQDWHEPTGSGQPVAEEDGEKGPGGGDESVVEEPPSDDASDNPQHDESSEPSDGSSEGVTNDANDDEAQTKASDDGNQDEASDSNDDTTDTNSGDSEGSGDGDDKGAASGDPGAP